jgi:lipopolysaccharide export system protein LptA
MCNKQLLFGMLICCVMRVAAALENDMAQAIEIQADRMTLDESSGTTRYEGSVRLSQGSISISADKLILTGRDGKLQRMQIGGTRDQPAEFRQKTESGQLASGKAQEMDFNVQSSHLILSGRAELNQGSNFIRSERIEYNTLSNSLLAGKRINNAPGDSDQDRVHIVITPEQK